MGPKRHIETATNKTLTEQLRTEHHDIHNKSPSSVRE